MAEFHSSYCFDVHLQKKICEVRPMLVDGILVGTVTSCGAGLASILLIVEVAAVVLLGMGGGAHSSAWSAASARRFRATYWHDDGKG